jgi:multidrug resistance efflux pump
MPVRSSEANIARYQAQLKMAERDLRRYSELVGKGATPQLNVFALVTTQGRKQDE